jgi:uncharacterized membrane protein
MTDAARPQASPPPELKNVREIVRLEHDLVGDRSIFDRLTNLATTIASGPAFLVVHLLWFGIWMFVNTQSANAFDPFPFGLLVLVVSLEAIILTALVLGAQVRMTRLAEERARLDLQVDLLAEQELTAILRVVCAVAERAGIDVSTHAPGIEQFRSATDVRRIAAALDTEKVDHGRRHRVPKDSP